MVYFTSDLHLGGEPMLKNRPIFKTVDDMDNTIITNWNKTVKDDDDIYIVGDICYKNESIQPAEYYLKELKGKKHLIVGCHDYVGILPNEKAKKLLYEINMMQTIDVNGKQLMLLHYPMVEWGNMYRGSFHLFGHVHDAKNNAYRIMKDIKNAYNVGCMLYDYTPQTFEQIQEKYCQYIQQGV